MYLGAMVGLVERFDWPNRYPRNPRFIKLRVRIKPNEPLPMGFLLKLDNNLCGCKFAMRKFLDYVSLVAKLGINLIHVFKIFLPLRDK